jgi:xanthine dehydrogenase accessory factor
MNLFTAIAKSLEAEHAVVLVTLVGRHGSGSRKNARFAVTDEGKTISTIGGGRMEYEVTEKALDHFTTDGATFETIGKNDYLFDTLDEEFLIPLFRKAGRLAEKRIPFVLVSFSEGNKAKALVTGTSFDYYAPSGLVGEETVRSHALEAFSTGKTIRIDDGLYDFVGRMARIILFGGGYVSQEVATLAYRVEIPVIVVEERESWATKGLFPHALSRIVVKAMQDAVPLLHLSKHDAVLLTKDSVEEALIGALLDSDASYVGMLSSRKKAYKWRNPKFYAPVGLDIGGESPEETALSIVSEIEKVMHHESGNSLRDENRLIIVRGAGDLATGTIIRLAHAGYPVLALETGTPTVIRRTVSLAEAMFSGVATVEDVTAKRIASSDEAYPLIDAGIVPILADSEGKAIAEMHPEVVIDAIIAKRNLGTHITDAPLVIALGPGFTAGVDCHVVIETQRGHNLGRIIRSGSAAENTGVPGVIAGYGIERVIHAPCEGTFNHAGKEIGDLVEEGETIAMIGEVPVKTVIAGKLRGLLRDGLAVTKGFKVADVDPRGKEAIHTTVSDKANAIAGGVLEAVDAYFR